MAAVAEVQAVGIDPSTYPAPAFPLTSCPARSRATGAVSGCAWRDSVWSSDSSLASFGANPSSLPMLVVGAVLPGPLWLSNHLMPSLPAVHRLGSCRSSVAAAPSSSPA